MKLEELPKSYFQTLNSLTSNVWEDQTGKLLTGSDDDGSWLVVDGHGAVVGGDGEPARHLVQAALHVRPVGPVAPGTVVRVHGFNLRSGASSHFAWNETYEKRCKAGWVGTSTVTDKVRKIEPNSISQSHN